MGIGRPYISSLPLIAASSCGTKLTQARHSCVTCYSSSPYSSLLSGAEFVLEPVSEVGHRAHVCIPDGAYAGSLINNACPTLYPV